jgi:hypothetical protein
MIHYHGTPITPKNSLLEMSGRHFCVSFAEPRDLEDCLRIGQSVMLDNGAFSTFTRGKQMDFEGYYQWVDEHLQHPHWAVVPDVIDGTVEQQRQLIEQWPFPRELSAPVWHLGLSLEWLVELATEWPRICLGSSGAYWQVGSSAWCERMDQAYELLTKQFKRLPWVHGMRMLGQSGNRWPLASADSTNVARNFKRNQEHPDEMASRIDAIQPARRWKQSAQMGLV